MPQDEIKKDKQFQMRVSEDFLKELDEWRFNHGWPALSRSEALRHMMTEFLKTERKEREQ